MRLFQMMSLWTEMLYAFFFEDFFTPKILM